jgi:hypothetical protein
LFYLLESLLSGPDVSALLAKFEQQQSTLDALQKTVAQAVSRKRRELPMSDIDSESWREVEASGFKLVPEHWPATLTSKLMADAPAAAAGGPADVPFPWTDENENQKADKYTQYVRARLSPLPPNVRLVAAPGGLLSTNSTVLPFNVKGTADLVLVEQASLSAKLEASGIHAVIELKKDLDPASNNNKRARQQAMVELIVADVSSAFLPFVLLTDLKDSFTFFWLDEAKDMRQIHFLVPPTRQLAFLLLNRLVARCTRGEGEVRAADAYLATLGVGIHKRRKLSVVAERRGPRGDEESDCSVDGPSWDEEDIPMLLRRQVRKAMRNTPFLQPYVEPPFSLAIQHAMFAYPSHLVLRPTS